MTDEPDATAQVSLPDEQLKNLKPAERTKALRLVALEDCPCGDLHDFRGDMVDNAGYSCRLCHKTWDKNWIATWDKRYET